MDEVDNKKIHLATSWSLAKTSLKLVREYIEPVLVIGLLPILTFQLGSFLNPASSVLGRVVYLTGALWIVISVPALLCLEIRAARKQPATISEMYKQGLGCFFRVMGLTILTGLIITAGFLLLIFPGVIFLRRYILAPYYLIDRNSGIRDAMRQSAADSKPVAGYIYGSLVVTACISIIAALVSLVFSIFPGVPDILASILGLASMFILALRYVEIDTARHGSKVSSDS